MLWLMYGNVSNLAVQYLYRYFALCRDYHMSKNTFAAVVITGWIPILTYNTFNLARYALSINPNTTVPESILKDTEWDDGNNLPTFAALSFDGYVDVFVKIQTYSVLVFYAIVVSTMVLVFWTLAKLNYNTHLSKQTLQAQRQLTLILLFEAFLPLCTIVLPIFVDIANLHGYPLPTVSLFAGLVMFAAPLLTATVKMLTIKSFRRCVFSYLAASDKGQSDRNTTVIVT
uniref:G_PROTEIN_RECEP_F1_2 domain-containing protein n=1 Tax=Panagrellus redivivus TaxID=6233 RepID=A0A7E4V9D0_PANRE